MNYFLAFSLSFLLIAAKATQQLQVVHFLYWRILPTSMVMAFCEVFGTLLVVKTADSLTDLALLAVAVGLGAGFGCLLAMTVFQRGRDASR